MPWLGKPIDQLATTPTVGDEVDSKFKEEDIKEIKSNQRQYDVLGFVLNWNISCCE